MKIDPLPLRIMIWWKLIVIGIAILAIRILPLHETFILPIPFRVQLPYLLWTWGNFDGLHYLTIAERGYAGFQHPFFPLYPWLIGTFSEVTSLPLLYSALIISHVCFLIALYCLYRLIQIDKVGIYGKLFFTILILYPASFYYGAVYNDSLFLVLASIALILGRKRLWLYAGIAGGFASLTRMNGLAIFAFLLVEYLLGTESVEKQWKWNLLRTKFRAFRIMTIFKEKAWGVLLVPVGFFAYLIYTQQTTGNWRLIFTDQSLWFRDKVTFPLQVFWRYFKIFITVPVNTIEYWRAVWEFGFVLIYIFLMIYGWRKIRPGYWIFFFISVLIPVITGTFQGMPRYGLHIYPMFLLLSIWLSQRGKVNRYLYFLLSCSLLALFTILFTRGIFVA